MRRRYRPGDSLTRDERTGFTTYMSETRKEWTGARVSERVYEERHPQDFVRGRKDDQYVPDSRPKGVDTFIGPLVTELNADHVPGDTSLTVESSTRMEAGDKIRIMLDNNDMFRVVVQTVSDATTIVIADPLPGAASTGNQVIDETAMSDPDTG